MNNTIAERRMSILNTYSEKENHKNNENSEKKMKKKRWMKKK